MAVGSNKDVTIRFNGRVDPSFQGAMRQTERQLVTWRDRMGKANASILQGLGQGIGGRFGTGISAGLAGGFAGAGAFAAAGIAVKGLTTAFESLAPIASRTFEKMRLDFVGVPEHARRATKSIDDLRQAYEKLRQGNIKSVGAAAAGFGKAVQPTLGPFQQSIPDLKSNEISAFQTQRAALEKQRMDSIKRSQSLQFGSDPEGRRGRVKFVERGIHELQIAGKSTAFMRPELGKQFDAELAKANADIKAAEAAMTKLDEQVARIQQIRQRDQQRGFAIGRGVRGVAGAISGGVSDGIQGMRGLLQAPLKAGLERMNNVKTQLDLERAIESPAAGLRREFNDLLRMRREGAIGDDLFGRARQHLAGRLQGMLPAEKLFGPTPGLNAVETRTLTMGRSDDTSRRQLAVAEKANTILNEVKRVLEDIRKSGLDVQVGNLQVRRAR